MSLINAVSAIVVSTLLLISCGGEQSITPILSDSENSDPTAPSVIEQPQTGLAIPEFQGNLEFSSTLIVDLDPMLAESDLNRAYFGIMARDGLTVRVPVKGDNGHDKAFILIDTDSGEASWMFRYLSDDTRVMFNADNRPIAVLAIGCGSVSYLAEQEMTLFDMTSLMPVGRCFSADQKVSADGDVVLIGSYVEGTGTPYLSATADFHAYTFNTASLTNYPSLRMSVDGVALSPKWPDSLFSDVGFSDDGRWVLTRQWWEGIESFGATRRQVGAVLWDTLSGEWRTLGLMADQRSCIPTRKVSCRPPYSYVMSSDGMTQYAQIPTSAEINQGAGPVVQFVTTTEKTGTNQPSAAVVAGLESGAALTMDSSGRLLVFFAIADTDKLRKGYMLYDDQTGQYLSLSRSLRACPSSDEGGNSIDESECVYNSIPGTITSNATAFSADGSRLLLRSISRSTDSQRGVVDNFLVDIDDSYVYTIPKPFSGDPLGISGDGSSMLGVTGFPDYDFVIGKR
ncbi:MAG: hypothetical protein ACI9XK_002127 [Granulosicoccus sp.]|jgi:hypothetical protein